jgi:hypothetical protein
VRPSRRIDSGLCLIPTCLWGPQNQDVKICVLALGFVWAVSLCGQSRFSWQDYCFKNPGAPVCRGNDYAVKPPARTKDSAPRNVVTSPRPSTSGTVAPSLIVVGGIDWRFADPFADALVGFNFRGLSNSLLTRSLIAQLGAKQGLTEADIQKIFDGLAGVDQVALSIRNNRMVALVTGSVADSTLPPPEAGLKAVPISGSGMLFGHADAVDQAVQRIAMKIPPTELTRLAEERQASSDFWAIGSAGLVGPQAVSAGVKRFSLTVWIRDRLTSDVALEFNRVPSANTLQKWQTKLGATTVEGNSIHLRVLMEADDVQQKFGQIVASPLGQGLAALVESARYLPVRESPIQKRTKPMIYGLDGGPKEVNQYPDR